MNDKQILRGGRRRILRHKLISERTVVPCLVLTLHNRKTIDIFATQRSLDT
jgi:hypothetical protein